MVGLVRKVIRVFTRSVHIFTVEVLKVLSYFSGFPDGAGVTDPVVHAQFLILELSVLCGTEADDSRLKDWRAQDPLLMQ